MSTQNPKQSRPRVDPHIRELSIFAYANGITPPCEHILSALAKIDRTYPNLSFCDFLTMLNVLAQYERQRGHA